VRVQGLGLMVYGLGFLLLFGGRIISEHLQSVAQGAEKPEMRRVREGVLLRSEMVLLQSVAQEKPEMRRVREGRIVSCSESHG